MGLSGPNRSANAVELTVESAWFIAEAVQAGTFPWVLAITSPYRDPADRTSITKQQTDQLMRLGIIGEPAGVIDPAVADWVRLVCNPEQWIELRCCRGDSRTGDMLRGIVARRGDRTVVALRNAQLITFTAVGVRDPHELVPILTAGLCRRAPAHFAEFALPARVGRRVDQQLHAGADVAGVLDYLGILASARSVMQAALAGPRNYVEIMAGQNRDGVNHTTEVGVGIVDSPEGRILITPRLAGDREWVSTFAPGNSLAIARAIEDLTGTLPDGRWFPEARLSREFATHAAAVSR